MAYKVGSKIQWKWLGRTIEGVVKQVFTRSVSKTIKGKTIKRNGTEENPAYLVESEAGNLALKLQTELSLSRKTPEKSKRATPTLFR